LKTNLTSSNSSIDTSTDINNNNIDPKFLLSSNFESNYFFTDLQDERANHQSMINDWMLPISLYPSSPINTYKILAIQTSYRLQLAPMYPYNTRKYFYRASFRWFAIPIIASQRIPNPTARNRHE
ncbi:15294_t:CDS:1, partial [Funneliformis mosseae]